MEIFEEKWSKEINVKELILFYKNVEKIKQLYNTSIIIPYFLDNYSKESHNLIKNFNNLYEDKKYIGIIGLGHPNPASNTRQKLYTKEKVHYLSFPHIDFASSYFKNFYTILLEHLFLSLNIGTMHISSSYIEPIIINFCKFHYIKSIYEIKGDWNKEKICITNSTNPLFILPKNKTKPLNLIKSLRLYDLITPLPKIAIVYKYTQGFTYEFNYPNFKSYTKESIDNITDEDYILFVDNLNSNFHFNKNVIQLLLNKLLQSKVKIMSSHGEAIIFKRKEFFTPHLLFQDIHLTVSNK